MFILLREYLDDPDANPDVMSVSNDVELLKDDARNDARHNISGEPSDESLELEWSEQPMPATARWSRAVARELVLYTIHEVQELT